MVLGNTFLEDCGVQKLDSVEMKRDFQANGLPGFQIPYILT